MVSGHWSAWQAARVEVNQQRAEQEAAQTDLPTEVADQVIARTGLTPTPKHADQKTPGPTTAAPMTATIAAARELVRNRCHLDAGQALTYLANYTTLTDQDPAAAARQLLRSISGADRPNPSELTQIIPGFTAGPPDTAGRPTPSATTRTERHDQRYHCRDRPALTTPRRSAHYHPHQR